MTYTCPAWQLVGDIRLLKVQHLQNMALRTNGNFAKCTPVCDMRVAFQIQ
jgi:hypothetical protein